MLGADKETKRRIQKKISRRLQFRTSCSPSIKSESSEDLLSVRYGVNTKDLIKELERTLSSESSDVAECWTPASIIKLVESLKVPLEILAAVIKSINETFK